MKTKSGLKELYWGAINQDSKGGLAYKTKNPFDPLSVESKTLQGDSEEVSTYAVISSLHIKLDGHETTVRWRS